jgi:hypothetical protein
MLWVPNLLSPRGVFQGVVVKSHYGGKRMRNKDWNYGYGGMFYECPPFLMSRWRITSCAGRIQSESHNSLSLFNRGIAVMLSPLICIEYAYFKKDAHQDGQMEDVAFISSRGRAHIQSLNSESDREFETNYCPNQNRQTGQRLCIWELLSWDCVCCKENKKKLWRIHWTITASPTNTTEQ